jgi:hypothetical protein
MKSCPQCKSKNIAEIAYVIPDEPYTSPGFSDLDEFNLNKKKPSTTEIMESLLLRIVL